MAESRFARNAGFVAAFSGVPELPDITVYVEALEARVVGQVLERVRLLDIFVLR